MQRSMTAERSAHRVWLAGAGLALALSLLAASARTAAAQPGSWPGDREWIRLEDDPNDDCGGTTGEPDHREVTQRYYLLDDEWLYLRMCTQEPAGWAAHKPGDYWDARYKWFIDTDGDAYITGTNARDAEFVLLVEDRGDNSWAWNSVRFWSGDYGGEDQRGEQYLLDDSDGNGNHNEWIGGTPPHYIFNTLSTPSTWYKYTRASDSQPLAPVGATAQISDRGDTADIGFRIANDGTLPYCADHVDMYVSRAALGGPSSLCLLSAVDGEGGNLDQSPDCDRITAASCVVITEPTGMLEVVEDVVPDDASTNWVLTVSGPTRFQHNLTGDGRTGLQTVNTGDYTIVQAAGEDTDLDDYNTSWFCSRCTAPGVCQGEPGTGTTSHVFVGEGEEVVCTFTNERKRGRLEIWEKVVPDDPGTSWEFDVSGPSAFHCVGVGDFGCSSMVNAGDYSIVETASDGTNLDDYETRWECAVDGADGPSGTGTKAQVMVGEDDEVLCAFVNSLAREADIARLDIVKYRPHRDVHATWIVWYYIDLTNVGTVPAEDIVVMDELPPGIAAYSVMVGQGGKYDAETDTVAWSVPTLGPGQSVQLWIRAQTYSWAAGLWLTNLACADSADLFAPVCAIDVAYAHAPPPPPTSAPTATQTNTLLPSPTNTSTPTPTAEPPPAVEFNYIYLPVLLKNGS